MLFIQFLATLCCQNITRVGLAGWKKFRLISVSKVMRRCVGHCAMHFSLFSLAFARPTLHFARLIPKLELLRFLYACTQMYYSKTYATRIQAVPLSKKDKQRNKHKRNKTNKTRPKAKSIKHAATSAPARPPAHAHAHAHAHAQTHKK